MDFAPFNILPAQNIKTLLSKNQDKLEVVGFYFLILNWLARPKQALHRFLVKLRLDFYAREAGSICTRIVYDLHLLSA
jgi:hypothetical protein